MRHQTLRREIIDILRRGYSLSVRDLSREVGATDKAVLECLDNINRTLRRNGEALGQTPAECLKCGFSFKKRTRRSRPGRGPDCKGESITEPLFSIKTPSR